MIGREGKGKGLMMKDGIVKQEQKKLEKQVECVCLVNFGFIIIVIWV